MSGALSIRSYEAADRDDVVALWTACNLVVPWNDPVADIALAVSKPNATILIGSEEGRTVASVMVGHDGHRGWFYYLAVDPARRGCGYGRALVAAAEGWLREAGMPKAQLMVRATNHAVVAFYERLGYATGPVTVMQKWLKTDSP
ncbi:GNAT family acetyltransferase [Roseomonas genomospecies 6]|uniref:GNAT family acetyltransferase n=1 Tax=Roseomonas genomospecies 6 TaxID=214106 RepID=A0A9W7NKF1_9PROT|nr:GNAT family acetyltransferase [Roseomonas genomospecies 6]KAA0681369.1 GNAT family acetyltransferase [Roseomonas genomospecies 6]